MSQQQPPRPTGYSDPKTVYALTEFLVGQFAKTIVVFLRNDFGERYFNIVNLYGSSLTFGLFAMFAAPLLASKDEGAWILGLFLLGFILAGIAHQVNAIAKRRSGRRWHSRYAGTSYLAFLWPSNPFIVQRYVEPLIAVIFGYALSFINRPLGAWIVFAGLCLAATEQINAARARNRILDAIDAQIEAQNLGAAIAGNKGAEETEGFVLPVPAYYSKDQRKTLVDGMTRLDPALAAIMDAPEPAGEKTNTYQTQET